MSSVVRSPGRRSMSWVGPLAFGAFTLFGFVVGGVLGLRYPIWDLERWKTAPVDQYFRFTRGSSAVSILDRGWGRAETSGAPLARSGASVQLGFDGLARGDIDLLLEVEAGIPRDPPSSAPDTLIVSFNGDTIGRWRLPSAPRHIKRQFVISKEIFNKSSASARLNFETSNGQVPNVGFALVSLSIADVRRRSEARGHVDECTNQRIVGWAASSDAAAAVVIKSEGAPIEAEVLNVERSDVAKDGLPVDAGFEIKPRTVLATGTKVEVMFADGRQLSGSPCRP